MCISVLRAGRCVSPLIADGSAPPPVCVSSLALQVRSSRAQVQQELREREEVERELGLVRGWIQDTRGLLLSPTADLESLLHELEVGGDTGSQSETNTRTDTNNL